MGTNPESAGVASEKQFEQETMERAIRLFKEKTGLDSLPGNILPYFDDQLPESDSPHGPNNFTRYGYFVDMNNGKIFQISSIDGEPTVCAPYYSHETDSYVWFTATHQHDRAREAREQAIYERVLPGDVSQEYAENEFDDKIDNIHAEWEDEKNALNPRIKECFQFIRENQNLFPPELLNVVGAEKSNK